MQINIDPEAGIGWKTVAVVACDSDLGLIVRVGASSIQTSLLRWLVSFEDQGLEPPMSDADVAALEQKTLQYVKDRYGDRFPEFDKLFAAGSERPV